MRLKKFNLSGFTPCFILFCLLNSFSYSQTVTAIKYPGLEKIISKQNDTTYVINFWATWCQPCVKELPYFEKINSEYAGKKIKVVLLSLDFMKDMDKRLKPFVLQNDIKSEVYLFNEPDYNSWIDKVAPEWQGNIPATLIINNHKKFRKFFPNEFTYEELKNIIEPLTN